MRGDGEEVRPICLAMVLLGLLAAGCSSEGEPETAETTRAAGATTTRDPTTPGAAPTTDDAFSAIPDLVEELQPSVVSIVLDGGEGSGVIVDEDTIVTNAHVVGDARRVQVILASGRRVDARVDATDLRTDLALLSVSGGELPGAEFAEDLPRVG